MLGPYLFSVTTSSFSPDLTDDSHLVRYADDTTLCVPIFESSNQHIFQEHQNVLDWSSKMDLSLNKNKCKSLTIRKSSRCESVHLPNVESQSSLKILGVTFNSVGTWKSHVDFVVKTASRRFHTLRILKPVICKNDLRSVYFALVRSIFEYCSPSFISMSRTDAGRLERIQGRFHRLMCGKACDQNCIPDVVTSFFEISYVTTTPFEWSSAFAIRNRTIHSTS